MQNIENIGVDIAPIQITILKSYQQLLTLILIALVFIAVGDYWWKIIGNYYSGAMVNTFGVHER